MASRHTTGTSIQLVRGKTWRMHVYVERRDKGSRGPGGGAGIGVGIGPIGAPPNLITFYTFLDGEYNKVDISYQRRDLLEKKAILQRELVNRQEGDPLRSFVLFHPQQPFADAIIHQDRKENYYIGANRSGKSDAGAYAGSYLARFGYADVRKKKFVGAADSDQPSGSSKLSVRSRATSGWVSALDFPTGRDTIQPKYFDNGFVPPNSTHDPFIPEREIAEWRVSDQILKLKNGSIIGFKSADSGRKKYQGAEKDWIHFDEEHPQEIYMEAIIRVGAHPLQIFTTCTLLPPEGVVGGITWVYNEVVRPWKQGTLENAEIYNASIYDNPHIPEDEIRFLESKYPEGSDQRRIRLNGELIPGVGGSRVYSSFSNQLNVFGQRDLAIRRPLCWTWDFNVEPMVSLVGQKEGKIFKIYKELLLEEGNISEMCLEFKRHYPYHRAPIHLYGDATGKNRTAQTKMSSYQIILQEMVGYPVPVRMMVPESNPGVTDRINSVNVACAAPGGERNLEIDPSCSELISDLEQVLGDGKQGIKKTTNKKDPYFRRTHTSDALGYWIFFDSPIVPVEQDQRRGGMTIPLPGYRT